MRARSDQTRGWASATNVDVLDWLCCLDTQGGGTKAVHAADCAAVGSNTLEGCTPGSGCAKRYAAQSLDKGFVSKLKCAMSEVLGISEPWNDKEKRGNPADSAVVRGYLKSARVEQRRVGVTIQQARPMLAPMLLKLIRYMRQSARQLETAKARVERSRDIALFVTAFHTVQRGFDLSCALAAQVLGMPKGEGLIFNFHFGKTLRASSLAVVARRDRACHELCPVRAVQEFALVVGSMRWPPRAGYMFPMVEADGSKSSSPWSPDKMSAALQSNMSRAGLAEGRNYSMHSFRVGGAVSQTLAGTAIDALMDFVGWKSRGVAQRYVGARMSAPGGVTHSADRPVTSLDVESRYAAAIALPLQEGFEDQFAALK